jgi:hypothetical protein
VIRFLLWRLLGLIALLAGLALAAWCLDGGLGRSLRGASRPVTPARLLSVGGSAIGRVWDRCSGLAVPLESVAALLLALSLCILALRTVARCRRRYVRLQLEPYRTDQASAEAVVRMFERVQFLDSPGEARSQDATGGLDADNDDADERELVGAGDLEVSF